MSRYAVRPRARSAVGNVPVERRGFPAGCREPSMVEAGGQFIYGFRRSLDYAFILQTASGPQDAERVMPRLHRGILVLAPRRKPLQRVYESLQGRPEVGLLPTPRRYHAAAQQAAPSGFTDVSSVLIRSSRIGATLDRTPVRKHYASGSTYVAVSLFSRFALPEQQGRR